MSLIETTNPGSATLYRDHSGLEGAIADTDALRLIGTDAELVKETWDPYLCPTPLLPYLAWAMGVNFWNDRWAEETKRAWIAAQWEFKALRGTDAGVDMVVDFAGRDISPFGYSVNSITTAPQKLFSGPSLSVAAREAWPADLPQVRVYYYTSPASPRRGSSSVVASRFSDSVDGRGNRPRPSRRRRISNRCRGP